MEQMRVEKQIIKKNNKYYKTLDGFCVASKNLYNHANYKIRQAFIKNGVWIRGRDTDFIHQLKEDIDYPDYRNMPTSQSAARTVDMLDSNWKSFFVAMKDWKKNPNKYTGRPKMPKYLDKKNGRYTLDLYKQEARLKEDGLIHFPKVFNGFVIKPNFTNRSDLISFQSARFLPRKNHIVVELVYKVEVNELKEDNGRYLGIDLGVNNLAAVVNNFNEQPFIISGRPIKSVNQYFNKKIARLKKINKQMNGMNYTNSQNKLTTKRNAKISDYMHKASRYIVDYADENDVSVIVVGKNKDWKEGGFETNEELYKKGQVRRQNNQNFIQLPHNMLTEQIQYKAEEKGIKVVVVEEKYTSGTSFLDNEEPVKENYDNNRREHRGLFIANDGAKINADINAALQMIKKALPNAYADGIEGIGLYPVKVDIA